jgi:hypothetical protein
MYVTVYRRDRAAEKKESGLRKRLRQKLKLKRLRQRRRAVLKEGTENDL